MRTALTRGPVVACEVVVSEVVAGLGHGSRLLDALEEVGISYSPLELRSAVRAGEMQRRYNERMRAAGRTLRSPRTDARLPDRRPCLLQCSALITRDAGFFRDYFKGLKVIVPKAG